MDEKIRFFPKIIKATKSFMDIHIHSSLRGLDVSSNHNKKDGLGRLLTLWATIYHAELFCQYYYGSFHLHFPEYLIRLRRIPRACPWMNAQTPVVLRRDVAPTCHAVAV